MAYTSQGLIELGFKWEEDFTIVNQNGEHKLTWKSSNPQPTAQECESAHLSWESKEYARNRQAEYPALNDLIVALWENVVEERAASVIALEAKRQEIKAKYPK